MLNLLDPFSQESIRIWKVKNQDIKRAFNLMMENRDALLEAWRKIHG